MIRIHNVRILTMEEDRDIFFGELWIEGAFITYVGPSVDDDDLPHFKQVIDGEGNLMMPGFKNAHAHTAMTFLRGASDDLTLHEWLNQIVFPAEAKLTEEDVYWLTHLGILEYLSSGITACFDMYPFVEARRRAYEDAGFRAVFCGYVNNFISSVEEMEEQFTSYLVGDGKDGNTFTTYQLGFHAEYTTSRELLQQIALLSHKYEAPVFMHCSETRLEVEECIKTNGMGPVQYMDSLGLFDFGGGVFHGVFLSDDELKILAEKQVMVITNPASNLKLASGVARIIDFQKAGVTVALGTDGPASNNALDMFREMYLVTALQKVSTQDPAALPAYEVLKMATVHGSHTMRLYDTDVLKVGNKADLIMINLNRPNMQPLTNLINHLVYSANNTNVKMTMIDGVIHYMDGQYFVSIDVEEIYKKANEIYQRILVGGQN